jgi:XXXCH domain-containing protein
MTSKRKYNWRMTRGEAADLLRRLADTLEGDSDEVGDYGISLAELIKFKIKIDLSESESMEVKFTGKGEKVCCCCGEDPCGSGPECENYSSIKKRMQKYFRALCESVVNGVLPSREIVAVFLEDSEKMVEYQGYGDEFYPEYMMVCAKLREAVDAEDLQLVAGVVEELTQAKKRCHDIYK